MLLQPALGWNPIFILIVPPCSYSVTTFPPTSLADSLLFTRLRLKQTRCAQTLKKTEVSLVSLALFVTLCSYSSLRSSHLASRITILLTRWRSNILATLNHLNKHRPRSFHSLNVLFASVLFLGLLLLCSILGPPLSTQALL
jgi:hypothetical protein